jgi:hypothetical protein
MEAASTLNKKLLEFQKNISAIKKTKKNPHFKNTYSDINEILSEVKPILSQLNIVLSQPIVDGIQYSRIIDSDTGETLSSSIKLPDNLQPQQLGSAITYYRRYTLVSLLSLETEEDNDGNGTTPPQTPPQTPPTDNMKWLNVEGQDGSITKEYANVLSAIEKKTITSIDQVKAVYKMTATTLQQLEKDLKANGN